MSWFLRAILAGGVIAVIGLTALFAIPADQITQRVTTQISQSTGRAVLIRGPVRPRLFPQLGIRAEGIEIGNPDWVAEGPMLIATALDIGVAWAPLLRGEIQLQQASLVSPRLILVRDADGAQSWDLSAGNMPAQQDDSPGPGEEMPTRSRLLFNEINLLDAAFLYVDHQSGQVLQLSDITAAVVSQADSGAVTLDLNIKDVVLNTEVLDFAGLQSGVLSDVTARATWPGGTAGFEGQVSLQPGFSGEFDLAAETVGPVFESVGMSAPDLPIGLGRDRVELNGAMTLSETGSLHMRNAALSLDDNFAVLDLDLTQGPDRPLVRGNISTGYFGIPTVEPSPATDALPLDSPTDDPIGGWSEALIEADVLFALDAELVLVAERLELGDVPVRAVAAGLSIDDGRLQIDLAQAYVFGGTVSGLLAANARNVFSARAELALQEISLAPMLAVLADQERLEGTLSGDISIVAQGESQAALMRDLDGQGQLAFGPGAIAGLDIAGMIRNMDTGFRGPGARTVYSGITASFAIEDGVLDNRDLILAASWGDVRGAGQVDIGQQRVDYLVTPSLGGTLTVPVRIEGPWADPSYRPDLEALAEQELSGEIDRLQDRAEDAVRDLVADELGVAIPQNASRDDVIDQLEQGLEDRLEQELTDRLRGLFE